MSKFSWLAVICTVLLLIAPEALKADPITIDVPSILGCGPTCTASSSQSAIFGGITVTLHAGVAGAIDSRLLHLQETNVGPPNVGYVGVYGSENDEIDFDYPEWLTVDFSSPVSILSGELNKLFALPNNRNDWWDEQGMVAGWLSGGLVDTFGFTATYDGTGMPSCGDINCDNGRESLGPLFGGAFVDRLVFTAIDASGGTSPTWTGPNSDYGLTELQVEVEPIPEPGSIFLFGTGLLGLSRLARRRLGKKHG